MNPKRRFFVESLPASGTVDLHGTEARHVSKVLRLLPGGVILLFDAGGRSVSARIEEIKKGRVRLTILKDAEGPAESPLRVTIYQAMLRPAPMEKAISMCSELGAESIVPMRTQRCRSRRPGQEKLRRWRRIAQESAKQCGRASLLAVGDPVDYDEIDLGAIAGSKYLLDPGQSGAFDPAATPRPLQATLLVGPEGGWEEDEIDRAFRAGFAGVGLGPRTLRSETAAVAALSILQQLYGDLARGEGAIR